MSKEAYLSLAILTVLASFSTVPGRVQPALKHTVSKLTVITAATTATAILRTNSTRVVVASGVTPASFLARVSKWTVGPVMAPAASAAPDLEFVHSKMIGGVRVNIVIRINKVVTGKKLLHKSLVRVQIATIMGSGMLSEELPGWDVRVRVQITTVMGSGTASEELPGWDVIVSDHAFLGRKKLVELVLISTNTAHFAKIITLFRENKFSGLIEN